MRFPMTTYLGDRPSRRKLFQLNVSAISLIAYVGTFFRTALFLEKLLLCNSSEKRLRHNSYFFGAAISSEQLLCSRSFFSKTVASSRRLLFSEQLLFQSETSTEQPVFENRQFFRKHFFRRGTISQLRFLSTAHFLSISQ